jgi:GNAT superfamily N-acetyltransferase
MGVDSVAPVSRESWPALEDLFGRSGASNGCWCMYWLVGPEYHKRPREQNRRALQAEVSQDQPPGLLALDETGLAVGWCRLTPRADLSWLGRRRELAPVDGLPVWSLPCFYVRRGFRGQDVLSSLIHGAIRYARMAGAPALEGYPVDTAVPGSSRNLFPGTASAFAAAGFVEVARRRPDRPIMRHYLALD